MSVWNEGERFMPEVSASGDAVNTADAASPSQQVAADWRGEKPDPTKHLGAFRQAEAVPLRGMLLK